jgi:pilus assembly protein FimV
MARETQGSPANEKKLEQYGVWVKVKPRDVTTAVVLEESFGLSDLEAPRSPSRGGSIPEESALTAEEEKLLDELETELDPGAEAPAISVPEEEPLLAETELPDIETAAGREGSSDLEFRDSTDEELPELEEDLEPVPRARGRAAGGGFGAEPAEVEVTLSENEVPEDHFDDLAALESELASVTTKTRAATASSAGILARIEDELKSIRTDLNQLRHDLSGLRKTAAEGGGEGPSSASGAQGGFFDEDEDETIALTGDELDNILNTAEITEESAEAPGAAADMDLMAGTEGGGGAEGAGSHDILSYETPVPEPVDAPSLDEDLEILEEPPSGETLVLSDDDLLPTDGMSDTSGASSVEDLPADLVLEELPESDDDLSPQGSADLPEIDLEGIPEMETEPAIAPAPVMEGAMDDLGSETIDLETLDLGEEPKVIDAVPEQFEEIEELQDAEDLPGEGSKPKGQAKAGREASTDEVDLEALAAEAEELEDSVPDAPVVEDLEIGELEALADEAGPAESPQKEIEISFEGDLSEDVEALQESVDSASPTEEVAEAEEVHEAGSAGIPDNLKDEIRTVLKYMDHLLEALPDEKIQEFASSDYFVMYKKLFEDLGLGE